MATMVDERAPIRGRRLATAGLTTLALLLVAGLGIWQLQSADAPAPSVEQAEEFSPEAVRVRNTAGLYVTEAFSPEAVRIANSSGLYVTEAFSPEAVRIANLADAHPEEAFSPEVVRMRNLESFLVGAN
ncbi:MAG TPA: hypothetical protein VFU96_05245 [Acidimicrobiia bacterium]|nr:hypothetical protein [Acidimicrobiia bacterium]